MASAEVNTQAKSPSGGKPELNLLLAPDTFEPLWKSLFRGLDEFFFPKKLPPLQLESKPIPVKDIWGFYNYKKNGALGSTAAHLVLLAVIIGGTILGRHMVTNAIAKPQAETRLIDPGDFIPLKPAKTQAGGGGGGELVEGAVPRVAGDGATGRREELPIFPDFFVASRRRDVKVFLVRSRTHVSQHGRPFDNLTSRTRRSDALETET